MLPVLPPRDQLADLCRETAAIENVEPQLVEKDFYLTRLLWSLADMLGDRLLLKGGTLLGKVDLGFLRMSEDADLVLPGTASSERRINARRMNEVREALDAIRTDVGVDVPSAAGVAENKSAHVSWELRYGSDFGPQRIHLEATIRPRLRAPRRTVLRQLADDSLLGDYSSAYCWSLDADEARAEKVRAACTREAIRDYYDLDRLLDGGADFASAEFIALVDEKLREVSAAPLARQRSAFALDDVRRRRLDESLRVDLPAVLRRGAPAFDLDVMLGKFEQLFGKPR